MHAVNGRERGQEKTMILVEVVAVTEADPWRRGCTNKQNVENDDDDLYSSWS
jgi:hypothetical protein